jgi:hypothetical protein
MDKELVTALLEHAKTCKKYDTYFEVNNSEGDIDMVISGLEALLRNENGCTVTTPGKRSLSE